MATTGSGLFAPRESIEQVEEGDELAPKFDEDGLIPVVTTDVESGEVLMHGYMNAEALEKTIETGEAHYWSRSRQALWHKGATSGLIQKVVEIRIDDDQDAVWLRADASLSGNHTTWVTPFFFISPRTVSGLSSACCCVISFT